MSVKILDAKFLFTEHEPSKTKFISMSEEVVEALFEAIYQAYQTPGRIENLIFIGPHLWSEFQRRKRQGDSDFVEAVIQSAGERAEELGGVGYAFHLFSQEGHGIGMYFLKKAAEGVDHNE